MESHAVKVSYLDASALVKLVADDPDEEPGRTAIREYYWQNTSHKTTSLCVVEALSAFKLKFLRKKISRDEYVGYVKTLTRTVVGHLTIDEMPVLSPNYVGQRTIDEISDLSKLLREAETLMNKYGLDFIDCVQIVTILHGKFSLWCGDSKSILITADRELAEVARAEGARVWECTSEPSPP